jgi:Xaa-Pro aminopeptidase
MAKNKGKSRPSPIIAKRIGRCRRAMKKHRIGAFLVSKPTDYFYLTGFTGEDSAILVTPREVHVISDGRFDEAINQECPWVTKWMRRITLEEELASVFKKLKIKSVAAQPETMTLGSAATIKKHNKSVKIAHAPPIVADMRLAKDPGELTLIRKSIRVAEAAFLAMRETIRVGQTEQELSARLEYEMQRRGSSGVAFPTIVAEGPNGALPHAHPGRRKVRKGSAILFDWGARVNGYTSDLTRMVFVGSIPRKIGEIYRIVLEAQVRAIAAIRAKERMCDVDAVARNFIADAGYKEAFNHGLGHGMGVDVHEAPRLSWQSKDKLKAGSVVTVEPGIYLPRVGGVRIEDDVLVTPTGHRVLTRLSKKLEDAVI